MKRPKKRPKKQRKNIAKARAQASAKKTAKSSTKKLATNRATKRPANRAPVPPRPARTRTVPAADAPSATATTEAELLRLAKEVAALAQDETLTQPLRTALETIVRACEPGRDLARARFAAASEAPPPAPPTLSIAWAREQLRLAVEELLRQDAECGRVRDDLPLDTLAWLLVAACEATTHDPIGVAADRVDAMLAVVERRA